MDAANQAGQVPEQSRPAANQHTVMDAAWVTNVSLLWDNRHLLVRVAAVVIVLSALVAFVIPKQYESSTSIMPPEQTSGSAARVTRSRPRTSPLPQPTSTIRAATSGTSPRSPAAMPR